MPKIVSPQSAQATSATHAQNAVSAAHTIGLILSGKDGLDDSSRRHQIEECAKVLEAAGCYIRRQHAKRLLVP